MNVSNNLINECKKGDRRAQNNLYEQCYDLLISICYRYEKNQEDARHMLNIGFLKIATNLEKFPSGGNFRLWIKKIMINAIIDEYRKNKKRKELISYQDLQEESVINMNFGENTSHYKHNVEELELMIQTLPGNMRKVFNLFAVDGYSHKEISELLNMPVGTSKSQVSKARTKLKLLLERSLNKSESLN